VKNTAITILLEYNNLIASIIFDQSSIYISSTATKFKIKVKFYSIAKMETSLNQKAPATFRPLAPRLIFRGLIRHDVSALSAPGPQT
jgi:hypothetical protein